MDVRDRRDEVVPAAEARSGLDTGLLRMVVAQVPAVLWSIDTDLRFTSSTGAGLAKLGLRPGEVVGVTLFQYFGTEDPAFPAIAAHLQALEGASVTYEQGWQGRVFESHVEPLRDAEGGVAGALGVALDVTERRRVEEALRETEAKYRGLVETVPALTYIDPVSEDEMSIYVSPQIHDLLGCSQDDWLNDPAFWRKHLHPADADRVRDEWARRRASGEPYRVEYRMLHEDGHVVWVSERAVILRDEHGEPWLVQGVMVDITERKRVEAELERALQRERRATEHLRKLDELKNLQLHAVSHDLRGPITAVLGSALVLEEGDEHVSSEKRAELVQLVVSGARKLDRLVTDLLDLDRLERGLVQPDCRPTDVGDLVRRVVAEVTKPDHPTTVVAGSIRGTVDPVQVERIVENLIVNAVTHTPRGTPIWVRAGREQGGVVLTVEDAGPGVPEGLRRTVFEPFHQGSREPGLGIGLSLVARFAELHGGWARVADRDGGGASFQVFLPDGGPPSPVGTAPLQRG